MPWVRAGACCSWEPGSSRIYSFVTCMGLGSRVAPLGWLLVDPGDPGIRRQLQECGAPGFFGRQSTGGVGGRGPWFTRSHSPPPGPVSETWRLRFNSPSGVYLELVAPVNGMNHNSMNFPWSASENEWQFLALGGVLLSFVQSLKLWPPGFPFHYLWHS